MKHQENTTVSIVSFLEVAKQAENQEILKKIGLKDLARALDTDWNNHLAVQKARYDLRVNLELVKNRREVRFKLVRKRLDSVRRMLRSHCKGREDLQKALHIHRDYTPHSTKPEVLFGYWNKLVNSCHLLTDDAFSGIVLSDQDRERCTAMEVAIQFYDAEDIGVTLHELDYIAAEEFAEQSRARVNQTFHTIETTMKNALLDGQAAWPMLEALFFPQRHTRVVHCIMLEALRHAC